MARDFALPEAPVGGDAEVAADAGDQLADGAVGEIGGVVAGLEALGEGMGEVCSHDLCEDFPPARVPPDAMIYSD